MDESKSVILVKSFQYKNEKLISRSQAKALLSEIKSFNCLVFDFSNVEMIGQAFADEIFRVKARENPDIQFSIENASSNVMKMINRANAG